MTVTKKRTTRARRPRGALPGVKLVPLQDAARAMEGVEFLHPGPPSRRRPFNYKLIKPALDTCLDWAQFHAPEDVRAALGVQQLAAACRMLHHLPAKADSADQQRWPGRSVCSDVRVALRDDCWLWRQGLLGLVQRATVAAHAALSLPCRCAHTRMPSKHLSVTDRTCLLHRGDAGRR